MEPTTSKTTKSEAAASASTSGKSAKPTKKAKAAITAARIARLEKAIDAREAALPALTHFVLPGGSPLGASLHLARTICRRAERTAVTLARQERVDARVLAYLNRLADLLFVLARFENQRSEAPEDRW